MPRKRRPSRPAPQAPRPAIAPYDPPALGRVAWGIVLGVMVLLVLIVMRFHPVGDYFTESDFYEYAAGGRGIARGHVDPARYVIIGPLYEFVLAFAGLFVRDIFHFGALLSAAAAAATLALWFELLRRRLGRAVGLWTILLLAANPVFFRYGYSATTDQLAMALQAASLFALLGWRGSRAPLWAGLFAALATLTRYNGIYLVPGALAWYVWLAGDASARRRNTALYLAGFAALLVPWMAFSVSSGHFPGENLLRNYGFYASESAARNVQDLPAPGGAPPAAAAQTLPPGTLVAALARVPAHLLADLRDLLGWPLAAACLLGLPFALRGRRRGFMTALALQGALHFVALLAAFYSDRYSMALAPLYLSFAGVAIATLLPGVRVPGTRLPAVWLLALVPLAFSVRASVALQRLVYSQLPVEALETARRLRQVARPGSAVIARKAAVAYYSGLRPVAFPRLPTLAALAEHARSERAEYLAFSWYEGELRPEFWFLLDSTAAVRGLSTLYASPGNPAILYRIGEGFGRDPAWMADSSARRQHDLRGYVRVLPDREAYSIHRALGAYAIEHGEDRVAADHFREMTRGRPDAVEAWVYLGNAELRLRAFPEALAAFRRAQQVEPLNGNAQIGRGMAEWGMGDSAAAAVTLAPVLDHVPDAAIREALRARSMGTVGSAPR